MKVNHNFTIKSRVVKFNKEIKRGIIKLQTKPTKDDKKERRDIRRPQSSMGMHAHATIHVHAFNGGEIERPTPLTCTKVGEKSQDLLVRGQNRQIIH